MTPEHVTDLGLRRTPALRGQRIGSWPAGPAQSAVQGTLALNLDALVPTPPTLTAVPAGPGPLDDALEARAQRFLQAVVEMLGADRPATQLLRWATPQVYGEVLQRVGDAVAASAWARRSRTGRPRVVSVRVSRPAPDVAEVAGRVRHDGRSRALAARLEHRQGRWQCTALAVG